MGGIKIKILLGLSSKSSATFVLLSTLLTNHSLCPPSLIIYSRLRCLGVRRSQSVLVKMVNRRLNISLDTLLQSEKWCQTSTWRWDSSPHPWRKMLLLSFLTWGQTQSPLRLNQRLVSTINSLGVKWKWASLIYSQFDGSMGSLLMITLQGFEQLETVAIYPSPWRWGSKDGHKWPRLWCKKKANEPAISRFISTRW